MNDIAQKNNIQIGYYNGEKILRIFALIDQVVKRIDTDRKCMISVNFILKQLFDVLGIEYKFIPLTRLKNTLKYYVDWWKQVYALIKDDITNKWAVVLWFWEFMRENPLTWNKLYLPEANFLAYFFSNLLHGGDKFRISWSKIFISWINSL